ncbi:hypothetical protein, partial [Achromobacter arsenitoxydans]|uniref:hypothetical protein n=1 Tax=Achromobacter arsenitoxydans TaxID=1147684 RepID=UPI001EE6532E
ANVGSIFYKPLKTLDKKRAKNGPIGPILARSGRSAQDASLPRPSTPFNPISVSPSARRF